MIANGPKINQVSTEILGQMKKRLDACYCSIHDYRKLKISVPCTKALETLRLAAFFGDSNKVNYIFNNLLGFYALNKSSDTSNDKLKDESDGYYSALYAASKNGYLDIVKTLLTHQNAKKATIKEIATAFRFALRNQHSAITDYLLENYTFDLIHFFKENNESLNSDEYDYAFNLMFKLMAYEETLSLLNQSSNRLSTKILKEAFREFQTLDSHNLTQNAKKVLNTIDKILQERGEPGHTPINISFKQLDTSKINPALLESLFTDTPEFTAFFEEFSRVDSPASLTSAPPLEDLSDDNDAVNAQDELVERLKSEGVSEENIAAIVLTLSEDTRKRRNTY
jgi:hypothetical protein